MMVHSSLDPTVLTIALSILGIIYLLPLFIALARRHRNRWAIGVVNVLLGWTILGWLVSFVWAVLPRRGRAVSPPLTGATTQSTRCQEA